jgi:PAS domain S-box-containing protein
MHPQATSLTRRRRAQVIVFGAVAIAVLILGVLVEFWTSYRSRVNEADGTAKKLVLALDEHAAAVFGSIDSMLQQTGSRLRDLGPSDSAATADEIRILREARDSLPMIKDLGRIDARGMLIVQAGAGVLPRPVDMSDRDYFKELRDGDTTHLVIGRAIIGRIDEEMVVPFARRIDDADGRFDGVIAGILPVSYLTGFFRSLRVGNLGLITLVRSDGSVLAREPADGLIGRSFANLPFFKVYVAASPNGSYRIRTASDNVDRITAYRTLHDYPAIVSVSLAIDDILDDLYVEARFYGSIVLGFIVGLLIFMAAILREITRTGTLEKEIVDSQSALEKSNAWLSSIMNGTFDGLVVLDAAGTIISFSDPAAAIFGYAPGDVVGHNVDVLLAEPASVDRARLLGQAAVAGGGAAHRSSFVIQGRRKDGSTFPMDLAVGRIASQGDASQFVLTLRDISEAMRVQEQLRQSQKMEAVGQLTGGVAHDFNNLLAVISGNLELVEENLSAHPDLRELVRTSIRATDRGATLTRSLLAFARRQPLAPQTLDMNELIGEMSELLRRTLPGNIEVQFVTASTWSCEADPGQLQNAILNLVANARDAMPEGGRLTIETGDAHLDEAYAAVHADVMPGDYVMLAVSDTGRGMSPPVLAHAFEPFFTTKEAGKGTGLGLSMVYGFAKQSGGHASIYSEVGEGTTVRMYLSRSAVAAERSAAASDTRETRGAGETILVVEDDPDMRRLTFALLRSLGYNVLGAASAEAALGILRDGQPISMLLTDVVLSGSMNGPRLAQAVDGLRPGIKVLYMSGYTENAILHHGRLDPGVQLLQKPFRKRDLAAKVRAILDDRTPA